MNYYLVDHVKLVIDIHGGIWHCVMGGAMGNKICVDVDINTII